MTEITLMASRVLVAGDRKWGDFPTGDGFPPHEKCKPRVQASNRMDELMIIALLDGLYNEHMIGFGSVHLTPFTIIEGCAKGADSIAHWWAKHSPCHSHNERLQFGEDSIEFVHECYPADWSKYGRAAGPIRNQQMLDEGRPNLVVGFHDDITSSKGTGDMMRRAAKAGIATYVVGQHKRPTVTDYPTLPLGL